MDLRSIQKPFKQKYRSEPEAARITLRAQGSETATPMACSVDIGRAIYESQAHTGVGGAGTAACSGDLLLGALAACAQLTLTLERFGTVDVLVNNAGLINTERHFLEADEAWWDRILGVNLKAAFLCSSRAAQVMARRRQGAIINLSSGGATRAHRGNAAYDASKGAVEALTRATALDLAPYGIRVNAIVPGSIDSQGMSQETKRERGEAIPMGRVGECEEIAGPVVFLASEDASYMTGHILVVDGGLLAQQRSPQVDIFPLSRFPKLEAQ